MNIENLTQVPWTDVRKGDVLLHENGDRLTVAERDSGVRVRVAGGEIGRMDAVWSRHGFFPYRKQPELPNEPGAYLDKDGDYWLIDRDGSWYAWATLRKPEFFYGKPRIFAPFTRLVPLPTREQIRAEAQVEALREAADDWHEEHVGTRPGLYKWLHGRADRIAREAGIETGESK